VCSSPAARPDQFGSAVLDHLEAIGTGEVQIREDQTETSSVPIDGANRGASVLGNRHVQATRATVFRQDVTRFRFVVNDEHFEARLCSRWHTLCPITEPVSPRTSGNRQKT